MLYNFDNEPHYLVDVTMGRLYFYLFQEGMGYTQLTVLEGVGPAIIPHQIKELSKTWGHLPYKVENH